MYAFRRKILIYEINMGTASSPAYTDIFKRGLCVCGDCGFIGK